MSATQHCSFVQTGQNTVDLTCEGDSAAVTVPAIPLTPLKMAEAGAGGLLAVLFLLVIFKAIFHSNTKKM